jgi:hypothetical protein
MTYQTIIALALAKSPVSLDSAGKEPIMPFEFNVDAENRILRITGNGPSQLKEVLEAVQSFAALAREHTQFALLSDTRELDYHASVMEILEIARAMFSRRELTTRRLAIVVQPGFQQELGRMLASMSGYVGMRVDVFTDPENALYWLKRGQP